MKLPTYLKIAILIFPAIIPLSLLSALTLKTNPLLWLVLPSIIFEQLFETCCYNFSNNQIANLSFAIIFWLGIGVIIGIIIYQFLANPSQSSR